MAKAILIMDMPQSCFQCRFLRIDTEHVKVTERCGALEVGRRLDTESYDKPDWCPLRELPEKIPKPKSGYDITNKTLYRTGWNACLDEILN